MSPCVSGEVPSDGTSNEQAPAGPGLASSIVANCHQITACGEVEAAGIAPASREALARTSTCVAGLWVVGRGVPSGRASFGLARHEFNLNRNKRLGSSDPELATLAGTLGRSPVAGPWLLIRQRDGERESAR